jgi:hexosaminidase
MNPEYKKQVLGVQGNFWSHINRIEPEMDRQIFPRLIALSEVGWSTESNKDWNDFVLRLNQHFEILYRLDIYYYE